MRLTLPYSVGGADSYDNPCQHGFCFWVCIDLLPRFSTDNAPVNRWEDFSGGKERGGEGAV